MSRVTEPRTQPLYPPLLFLQQRQGKIVTQERVLSNCRGCRQVLLQGLLQSRGIQTKRKNDGGLCKVEGKVGWNKQDSRGPGLTRSQGKSTPNQLQEEGKAHGLCSQALSV